MLQTAKMHYDARQLDEIVNPRRVAGHGVAGS
jgi:hypothetical protein